MKNLLIILGILLFISFAFLGFRAAANIGNNDSSLYQEVTDLDLTGMQRNYLLVHTNELSSGDSQLIAAWGLFIVYSSPPQVIFMPLYPVTDEKLGKSLVSAFEITEGNNIDFRFIREVEEHYNLTFTGYFMVDNTGLGFFHKWVTGESHQVDSVTTATDDGAHLVIYNRQEFFKKVCIETGKSGFKPIFNKIRWSELLPSHFSTNLSFESIALSEDLLKNAGKIEQCSVLSNE